MIVGLPLTYAYATLRQSVAGNSPFWGIVFCNLGTPKTVISKIVTTQQIEIPQPHVNITTPTMFPVDKKSIEDKNLKDNNVLIPF